MDSGSIGSITGVRPAAETATHSPTANVGQAGAVVDKARRLEDTGATQPEEAKPQRDPRSLQYQVDGDTHRVITTIIDDNSKTIVLQIPDAEVIRIAKAIERMQGFLVEEKA